MSQKFSILPAIIFLLWAFSPAFSQTAFEQEAWNFALEYEKAVFQNDIRFMEKHLAADFISIGPNRSIFTRQQSIDNAKRNSSAPFFRLLDLSSEIVRIKTNANLAIITTNWKVVRVPAKEKDAAAMTETGTSTTVYEKQEKGWTIVSEHVAFDSQEKIDDPVKEVGAASSAYADMLIGKNFEGLEKTLVATFVSTDENGNARERAAFLEELRAPEVFTRRIRNQNVYIRFFKGSAIETGSSIFEISRGGKTSILERRYTRNWIYMGGGWKLFSEHFSRAGEPAPPEPEL